MRRAAGFTLLEVLVAFAIAALALLALFAAAASAGRTTDALRERTWANLVAVNALAELRARGSWPAAGALEGRARQADRDWTWSAQVSTTDDADIRRIDFVVRDGGGAQVGSLIGFIGRPQVRPAATPP